MANSPDIDRPGAARVYDRLLGGGQNFAADREMAGALLAAQPDAAYWALANRLFLRRAVRFVLGTGVRQVLDIGCGLPDVHGNVHEIASAVAPKTRVVYVDNDPVVVASARRIAAGHDGVSAVQGDLRDPDAILAHPDVCGPLDWSQPIVILLGAVLHFVADADDPAAIVARFRDAMSPDSYLVVSHASVPHEMTPAQVRVTRQYSERTARLTLRSRDQVVRLFEGWELVEPGVCGVAFWRPEPGDLDDPAGFERAARIPGWVGVARKAPDPGGAR